MLSKTEYRNAYLNTYTNKNEKITQKSNINFLYLISLLSVPIIFTCVLGIFFDKNVNNENYDHFIIEESLVLLDNLENQINFQSTTNLNKIDNDREYESVLDKVVLKYQDNSLNNESSILKPKIQDNSKLLKDFDLKLTQSTVERKNNFINILLPLIIDENKKILAQRLSLIDIGANLNNNKTLSNHNQKLLNSLAFNYNVDIKNKHKVDIIEELLNKIDVIPNSIVLAQAANESGWGMSRFAQEYNALFGEYTYSDKNGVIPLERGVEDKHLVKFFPSINKSIESYFLNLNTHYAYKDFRNERSKQRTNNNFIIDSLVKNLDLYAEDKNYVKTLIAIIHQNKLEEYDSIPSI